MTIDREAHEANRRSWNAAVGPLESHKRDQAGFLARGGSTLFPEELELLGDLAGKSLVHLLSNAGQDTLSLTHHGAVVTGVDISDEAVRRARALSRESGLPGTFERSDVFDWLERAAADGRTFDRVFCSYGALLWLSDLGEFLGGVARILAPGGRFVVVEFHPFVETLYDLEAEAAGEAPAAARPGEELVIRHSYFPTGAPVVTAGVPDYVAEAGEALAPSGFEAGEKGFVNPHPDHTFPWTVSGLVRAVLEAGLTLERLEEWPWANGWKPLPDMVLDGTAPAGRRWRLPPGRPQLPWMLGLAAVEGRSR